MSADVPATFWRDTLTTLANGEDLSFDTAFMGMSQLMQGAATPAQIGAVLMGLQAKGVSAAEIAGSVTAMLDAAVLLPIEPTLRRRLVDTCGTGGDGAGTFNISTVAALVVAAAGVPVAKHGNRAASGTCGSADVLEQLGVAIDLDPKTATTQLTQLGFTFLFARTYHPAARFVAPARQELRIPTIFNLLGPLANPAGAPHQIVGVANPHVAKVMIGALKSLNKTRALVVTGSDGLDELTTTDTSLFYELTPDGQILEGTIDPKTFGIPYASAAALHGGDCQTNAAIARDVLSGTPGPAHDIVALNAGAALYVAGATDTLADGVENARDVLTRGAAADMLEALIAFSR